MLSALFPTMRGRTVVAAFEQRLAAVRAETGFLLFVAMTIVTAFDEQRFEHLGEINSLRRNWGEITVGRSGHIRRRNGAAEPQ
jgi:hypothetical protein